MHQVALPLIGNTLLSKTLYTEGKLIQLPHLRLRALLQNTSNREIAAASRSLLERALEIPEDIRLGPDLERRALGTIVAHPSIPIQCSLRVDVA